MPKPTEPSDAAVAAALTAWFLRAGRKLPWRTTPRDPWRSLVAEAMLQQTQVSRVVEYFERFVARFGSPKSLAAADESEVLGLWSGLGYYRRARHLHQAAQAIQDRFNGQVPSDVADLQSLPGVGRYTAGAIASIVFGRPEPIVDGNVTRVLLRLNGRDLDPSAKTTVAWTWKRAQQLVQAARDAAAFNEGLMELGATVCTPANPACESCPLAKHCAARARGVQARIPRAKRRGAQQVIGCAVAVVRDPPGRVLMEQRPANGMWAGMWQAPTLESPDGVPTAPQVKKWLGIRGLRAVAEFDYQTTHRSIHAAVWSGLAAPKLSRGRRWFHPAEISSLGISSFQRKALAMAGVTVPRRGAEQGTLNP